MSSLPAPPPASAEEGKPGILPTTTPPSQPPQQQQQPQQPTTTTPNHEIVEDEEIGSIVARCSVVAALHPDGATEPAVDWAIAAKKPFAVVPCCVFWKFSEELQRRGVRSYPDFLDYLSEKLPEGQIRRDTLPFDGRNTVLWWPGPE